ncbi:MAG: hypothetical protein MRECE_2c080 [Mycoplasmataceae bacterium CE_OT135]|nr:MAG: hypothetical protein MRECE_2c080 [Mycoplasmataceae bacterium CE_OT135]
MLPSQSILAQIPQRIFRIPNKRKESKRREHYCLFFVRTQSRFKSIRSH